MLRLFKPGNANGIIIYQWIDIKIGKKIICQIILKHEVSDTDAALRLFNLLITVFFCFALFLLSKNETYVIYDEPESSTVNNDFHFQFSVSITSISC